MKISMASLALLLMPEPVCDGEGVPGDDGAAMAHCDSCDLDHWIPALAAKGSIDCGRVELGADPTRAADCVEDALASDAPFTVRQELQGIDSQVELGFLVDRDGVVQQLTHDTNLCGSPMCTEHCGPVVWAQECASPRIGAMPEQLLIECDAGDSAALCEPRPPV